MEAEERPVKKRKLSANADVEPPRMPTVTSNAKDTIDSRDLGENGNNPAVNGDYGCAESEKSQSDEDDDDVNDDLPAPAEIAPLADSAMLNPDGKPMSKNQQKKLRKKQEWETKRPERRAIRKEKITAKRERKRERRKQALEDGESALPTQQLRKQKAVQLPVTILIDCDFDDLMLDKERISLASQITRSYSDSRNAQFRAHLAVCSFNGKLKERFDNILTHYTGWKNVHFLGCDFVEAAEKAKEWMPAPDGGTYAGTFSSLATENEGATELLKRQGEIVYLTSEADETLADLKPYSTYIIGGLVDRNRQKGICYKRATGRGVRTARLPIGEFMDMQSRKVLATNHVNQILLKWLECGNWGEAFMEVVPKRKGGKLKATNGAEDGDAEADEEKEETKNCDDHVSADGQGAPVE